jgi:hypothetical protein
LNGQIAPGQKKDAQQRRQGQIVDGERGRHVATALLCPFEELAKAEFEQEGDGHPEQGFIPK